MHVHISTWLADHEAQSMPNLTEYSVDTALEEITAEESISKQIDIYDLEAMKF